MPTEVNRTTAFHEETYLMENSHFFLLVQAQGHTIVRIHSDSNPDGVNEFGEEDEAKTYDPPDVVPVGDE
jgi:hypothetical protein